MPSLLSGLNLKTAWSAIADLIMPRTCIVCGAGLGPDERHICLECFGDMPLTRFEGMKSNPMADRFNAGMTNDSYEPYAYAAALFYYSEDNGYGRITRALKYGRNFHAGRMFAAMFAGRLEASGLYSDVDMIVPVPLHWTRHRKRGYNQAEVIARELSRRMGRPCCPDLLVRRRRTESQTSLGMEGKALNVSGAFKVNRRAAGRLPDLHHILIVDDVFTSGSTMRACHAALREIYGSRVRISAATLAFVQM